MTYPQDFPAEARARVEASRIKAGRKFDSMCKRLHSAIKLEKAFWGYVLTPFLVFAGEACRLQLWAVDKLDEKCQETLRLLTIQAYHDKGRGIIQDPTTCGIDSGNLTQQAKQEIRRTSQWRKYENIRLKLAESSSAQNSEKTAEAESKPGSRKPERDDPEVAKRAALVRSNPGTPAVEMCEIFDRESVPLPAKWQAAGLKTWSEAYRDSKYRSRIDTLISKDRRKG